MSLKFTLIWIFNTSCALTWINSAITSSRSTCNLWPKMLHHSQLWLTHSRSDQNETLQERILGWPRLPNNMNFTPQLPLVPRQENIGKYILLLRMLSTSKAAWEANRQQSCSDPSDAACSFNLGLFLFCSPSVSQLSDLIKPRLPQNSEEE